MGFKVLMGILALILTWIILLAVGFPYAAAVALVVGIVVFLFVPRRDLTGR